MKHLLRALLALPVLAAWAQDPPAAPAEDFSARSKALEVAGAFANDGFRIRDGNWPGVIEPGRPQIIQVNLFAGNEYWFTAAASHPARKLAVSVFDEKGQPADFLPYADGPVSAAGFEPEISGRYYVKLELLEGEKAPFCFLYSYK